MLHGHYERANGLYVVHFFCPKSEKELNLFLF